MFPSPLKPQDALQSTESAAIRVQQRGGDVSAKLTISESTDAEWLINVGDLSTEWTVLEKVNNADAAKMDLPAELATSEKTTNRSETDDDDVPGQQSCEKMSAIDVMAYFVRIHAMSMTKCFSGWDQLRADHGWMPYLGLLMLLICMVHAYVGPPICTKLEGRYQKLVQTLSVFVLLGLFRLGLRYAFKIDSDDPLLQTWPYRLIGGV